MLPGEGAARAVARRLRARMPSAFAAIDVAIPRRTPPWGGPMNGQHGRREIVRTLMTLRPPTAVIETGTYLGITTEYLAYLTGADVWTCESQSVYFGAARRRFGDNPLIHPVLADSPDFLTQLATNTTVPKTDVFFYLDAHWDASLPLRDELRIIGEFWESPWILIDDFQVPGDAGYGYDDYGPGAALVLDYLEPAEGWTALVPTLPSADETGARRGSVLLVRPGDSDAVVSSGLLRRV